MNIQKELFGRMNDGKEVFLYTLSNSGGLTFKITNYGGIIVSIMAPDRNGQVADIALGFNSLEEYLAGNPYFGTLIGRYANRIAKGRFTLNGEEYTLAVNNNGINHLHGGIAGFDKAVWDVSEIKNNREVGLRLVYLSKDGEEGYPGNLTTIVEYRLNENNELVVNYEATTDKPTLVNLTQHSYFNLAGESSGDILGHEMMINADKYTVVDETSIPTGEIRAVKGTPMDFNVSSPIGARIGQVEGGYDHNYVLNKAKKDELTLAARVYEPTSGRILEVYTTEPGIQFYAGNLLDGTFTGKSGKKYLKHAGFCLEAQHYPDSPNQPRFPTTVLNPGETYRQKTVYKFTA